MLSQSDSLFTGRWDEAQFRGTSVGDLSGTILAWKKPDHPLGLRQVAAQHGLTLHWLLLLELECRQFQSGTRAQHIWPFTECHTHPISPAH